MTSPSEPRTPLQLYHAPPPLAAAVWVTIGAVAVIYVLQVVLSSLLEPLVAVAGAYLATIAVLAGAARLGRFGLGVRPPPARFVIAAVLVGLTAWYIDLQLVLWLQPGGNPARLERLVERSALAPSLVAIALLPAIAEELVFRGVLARALATRSVGVAIVGSALVFSAYHVLPTQIVATFPLGLALGTMAVRSGSVIPGMIAHFLNNATVIVISRGELRGLDGALVAHPAAAFAFTLAVASLGVALAAKGVA